MNHTPVSDFLDDSDALDPDGGRPTRQRGDEPIAGYRLLDPLGACS